MDPDLDSTHSKILDTKIIKIGQVFTVSLGNAIVNGSHIENGGHLEF